MFKKICLFIALSVIHNSSCNAAAAPDAPMTPDMAVTISTLEIKFPGEEVLKQIYVEYFKLRLFIFPSHAAVIDFSDFSGKTNFIGQLIDKTLKVSEIEEIISRALTSYNAKKGEGAFYRGQTIESLGEFFSKIITDHNHDLPFTSEQIMKVIADKLKLKWKIL